MTSSRLILAIIPATFLVVAGCSSAATGSSPPSPDTSAAPAAPSQPTWGQTFNWKDGLAVKIDAPVPCKPGNMTLGSATQGRSIKFTVTFQNGTGKPFDISGVYFGTKAQFAGRAVEQLIDFDGDCGKGIDSTTVLPGKTFSGDVAFSVGAQPGEMQIAIEPALAHGYDKAIFVGQA